MADSALLRAGRTLHARCSGLADRRPAARSRRWRAPDDRCCAARDRRSRRRDVSRQPQIRRAFAASRAGAAFVDERMADKAPPGMALLITREPYKAFARAAQAFYPDPCRCPGARRRGDRSIRPRRFREDCDIGAHVVIEAGARLGARCRIGPNTVSGRRRTGRGLPGRRQCDAEPLPDRRPRRAASGRAHRPGRVRLRAGCASARSRCRSSAGSSSATMSISAPIRRSTAAPGTIR